MQRQIIYNLVEGDTYPPMPVRFTDMDLRLYASITMHVRRADGTRFQKILTKHPTDYELAFVTWSATDLARGRYLAEFKLVQSGILTVTLPRRYLAVLNIRGDI